MRKESKSRIYRTLSSAWVAGLLVFLTFCIGILGGASFDKLRCSNPLYSIISSLSKDYIDSNCTNGQVPLTSDPLLTGFWISLILFLPIFFFREIAIASRANREKAELVYLIRTSPPATMMGAFQALYLGVTRFTESRIYRRPRSASENDVELGIRFCLAALTSLAKYCEMERENTRYASNIMIFRNIRSLDDSDKENIMKSMGDFYPFDIENLSGILDLDRNLSTTSPQSIENISIDDQLPDKFSLPIPKKLIHESSGRKYYLPGAPTAFVEGDQLISDTRELLREYHETEDYKEISLGVFEHIDQYVKNDPGGREVRSFISISIPNTKTRSSPPYGVVNIHCNEPNIFREDWVYRSYLYLSTPFIWHLSKLIEKRS